MSAPFVNGTGLTPSQIYCLNPPSDSCEFGPCPNLDVTGTGQQVALGFAAIVFAITVVHNTSEVRLAYYSYLANIYSLLISAVISMSKVQLTRNDAVFVVVVLANPGTLYLWVIAFMALAKRPPRRIKDKITRHYEWKLFVCLSIVSFVLWFVMLGFVAHYPDQVKFSQPACSNKYGKNEIIDSVWSGVFLLRAGVAISLLLVFPRTWEQRIQSSRCDMDNGEQAGLNLTMWTLHFLRTSKFARYAVSPHFFASVLLMMQLSHITYFPFLLYGQTSFPFIVYDGSSFGSTYIFSFFIQLCLLAIIGASPVLWMSLTMPPKLNWLIMVTLAAGCASIVLFTGISLLDLVNGACWLLIAGINQASAGKWYTCFIVAVTSLASILSQWDRYYIMPVFPQIGWFLLWRVYSFRQSHSSWDTLMQLWTQTMDSVPVFKFTFLILSPTLAWVQSIAAANPTKSYDMTFGQVFALSIAILPSLSLAVTCYENWREILKAIWVTDIKSLESTGIPMHVRPPNISRGALNVSTEVPRAPHHEPPTVHPAPGSSETHHEWSGMRSKSARRQTM